MEERLQKIIAEHGIASRRAAEKLILEGKVEVNGETAVLGMRADLERDWIVVDGELLNEKEEKVYIMLHKPRGYVTTAKDEKGRKTVLDLIGNIGVRVYPVGRLDLNSEGLLILTNDGDFTYKMTHPSGEKSKEYHVEVSGDKDSIPGLSKAMDIDGYTIKPAKVKLLKERENSYVLSVTISEGRNRQIRKMCEKCGLKVLKLKRVSEGPLTLGKLRPGCWRFLSDEEIDACMKL